MATGEDYVYYLAFSNQLMKCYGDEFQQNFYRVMSNLHSNFVKIDTYGNQGDKKCDGYLRGTGIFYQVYGPRDTCSADSSIQNYAISKCEDDFLGLLNHVKNGEWEEVKSYVFVINNSRGRFPDLDKKITYLNKTYAPITFDIMDRDKLIQKFNSLNSSDKMLVTNAFVPDIDPSIIDNSVMKNIIGFLINTPKNCSTGKLVATDFIEKIQHNNLDPYHALNLQLGNYTVEALDEYLSSYPSSITDKLCAKFNSLYKDSLIKFPDDSNAQFNFLIDNCFEKDGLSPTEINVFVSNAYILLSKYFESCDIFEAPPKK